MNLLKAEGVVQPACLISLGKTGTARGQAGYEHVSPGAVARGRASVQVVRRNSSEKIFHWIKVEYTPLRLTCAYRTIGTLAQEENSHLPSGSSRNQSIQELDGRQHWMAALSLPEPSHQGTKTTSCWQGSIPRSQGTGKKAVHPGQE